MRHTLEFLLTLVATVLVSNVGLGVQARKAETDEGEMLLGLFVLFALPLVLASWFRRLSSEDPPMWRDLRQRLAGVSGERLPLIEPERANLFFPLPWFVLPTFLVFGGVGLLTEYRALLSVPIMATVVWVGMIGAYVVWWALSGRSATASGLQRMLADFRHSLQTDGLDADGWWVSTIFDRHRASMDLATLEALYRAGLEDWAGDADHGLGFEVTRLPPRYAYWGWTYVLESHGLVPRDESRHVTYADRPEPMQGWQCPRCHTINEPVARRCRLSTTGFDQTPLCRERRPGLSRVADLGYTIGEFVQMVVYLTLFFAPFLLVPTIVVGVLILIGGGDLTILLAGVTLAIMWLVAMRVVPDREEVLEGQGFMIYLIGAVLLWPFIGLAEALLSVRRRARRHRRRKRSS